jgi:uncharacterized membrane protein YeaQ/YmgE (transglycosylase-associated protein family)
MDISAATGYSKGIAPESWQLNPDQGVMQDRSFLIRPTLEMRRGLEKGKSPRELLPPTAICRAGPATRTSISSLTEESVMGIIAWIILGLGAGLLGNALIPGRRSQGLIVTCLIGVAGALAGGWLATRLFHVHTLNGFFNLSTWLTAIIGSAILLLAYHLLTSRGNSGSRRRRAGWAHR